MDIKAGIQTAIFMVALGVLLSVWLGIQSIRSGSKLAYYRLRQQRISGGWRMIGLSILLTGAAFLLGNFGEPLAYRFYPPSPTITLTPTITPTPTVSRTPTITLTPTITNTPSITDTPTPTSTPFVPAAIVTQFSSVVTPNPEVLFSPLTFASDFDKVSYQPVDPATVFENPIKRMVAIFSFDKMTPGAQWTALWYRKGELVHYETLPWDGSTGGYSFAEWAPPASEWLPGEYEVQIFIGLDWVMVGRFTVMGDAPPPVATRVPPPSPTLRISPTPLFSPTPTLTPTPSKTPKPSATLKPTRTRRPPDTPWPTLTLTP